MYTVDNTLKSTARAKHGKGTHRHVVSGTLISGNWQDFLRIDSNKTDLFQFFFHTLIDSFNLKEKQLVITDGESVLSKPLLDDLHSISPWMHEEVHTRMLLYVHHAAHHGHDKLLIRTVDTDVVVLAVSMVQSLGAQVELWLAFGIGKQFQYLAAHKVANGLGSKKALALPMFHALTGCDTVSEYTTTAY